MPLAPVEPLTAAARPESTGSAEPTARPGGVDVHHRGPCGAGPVRRRLAGHAARPRGDLHRRAVGWRPDLDRHPGGGLPPPDRRAHRGRWGAGPRATSPRRPAVPRPVAVPRLRSGDPRLDPGAARRRHPDAGRGHPGGRPVRPARVGPAPDDRVRAADPAPRRRHRSTQLGGDGAAPPRSLGRRGHGEGRVLGHPRDRGDDPGRGDPRLAVHRHARKPAPAGRRDVRVRAQPARRRRSWRRSARRSSSAASRRLPGSGGSARGGASCVAPCSSRSSTS